MCEYIVRYGWYGAPYAFKIIDDEGKMVASVLAGKHTVDNGYNKWLEKQMLDFDENQMKEATALKTYFDNTAPKVYRHMIAGKDLYLSYFYSVVPGCGKILLGEVMKLAKSEGYDAMYLWTDSSCDHKYYAHNGFVKVDEFESNEWKCDDNDYLTYIYKKVIG